MAQLVDVLVELFRAFGYTSTKPVELEGASGRRHPVPLVLEKDTRKLAVTVWLHRDPLGPSFLQEFTEAVKDTGCDGGLVVSLGSVPDRLLVQAGRERVNVWDARRTSQELGSAVLRETCPGTWQQTDPWRAPRQSQILDQVHQTVLEQVPADPPAPGPAPPVPMPGPENEPPFPAPIAPALAPPEPAPETLQVPLAFLDAPAPEAPVAPPVQVVMPLAAAEASAPAPPVAAAQAPVPATPVRSVPNFLRLQVNRQLAGSLAKPRTRTVDRLFLRLTPHHVFEYEANLLVEGTVKTERQSGRIAVDAVSKRIRDWSRPLECDALPGDVGETDERPVRVSDSEAAKLASAELRKLVTRDVLQEEDDSEWSVVVKKKVELAPDALQVRHLGVYWVPVWRVAGKDGSLEIDGATGEVVHEEITSQKSDALLL